MEAFSVQKVWIIAFIGGYLDSTDDWWNKVPEGL